jgi:hypothetical protein
MGPSEGLRTLSLLNRDGLRGEGRSSRDIDDLFVSYDSRTPTAPPLHISAHITVPPRRRDGKPNQPGKELRGIAFFTVSDGKRRMTQLTLGEPLVLDHDGSLVAVRRPITSTLLRSVPVERIGTAIDKLLDSYAGYNWTYVELAQALGQHTRSPKTDADYAEFAARYVAALRPRKWRLAQHHSVSAKTVSDWIAEARQRNLLTKTKRGVEGGELTEKARLLLRDRTEPDLYEVL